MHATKESPMSDNLKPNLLIHIFSIPAKRKRRVADCYTVNGYEIIDSGRRGECRWYFEESPGTEACFRLLRDAKAAARALPPR